MRPDTSSAACRQQLRPFTDPLPMFATSLAVALIDTAGAIFVARRGMRVQ